jgi:hypothetical protein
MIKTLRMAAVILTIRALRFVRLTSWANALDKKAQESGWGC